MFCTKCGTKLTEDANFCHSCGSRRFEESSNEPKKLAAKIAENYELVSSSPNFDAEDITEEAFLGIVYSELTQKDAVNLSDSGIEIMKKAETFLREISKQAE